MGIDRRIEPRSLDVLDCYQDVELREKEGGDYGQRRGSDDNEESDRESGAGDDPDGRRRLSPAE